MNLFISLKEDQAEKIEIIASARMTIKEIAQECNAIVKDSEKGKINGVELYNNFALLSKNTGYPVDQLLRASNNSLFITSLN